MSLAKTVKNIYDRLYRKGVKISRSEIASKITEIDQSGELSEEQKSSVVESFLSNETGGDDSEAVEEQEFTLEPETNDEPPIPYKASREAVSKDEAERIVFDSLDENDLDLKTSQINQLVEEIHSNGLDQKQAIKHMENLVCSVIHQNESSYQEELEKSTGRISLKVDQSVESRSTTLVETFKNIKMDLEGFNRSYKSRFNQHQQGFC